MDYFARVVGITCEEGIAYLDIIPIVAAFDSNSAF
jgi:hypothetical protein